MSCEYLAHACTMRMEREKREEAEKSCSEDAGMDEMPPCESHREMGMDMFENRHAGVGGVGG